MCHLAFSEKIYLGRKTLCASWSDGAKTNRWLGDTFTHNQWIKSVGNLPRSKSLCLCKFNVSTDVLQDSNYS